jgi:hypothetical protein
MVGAPRSSVFDTIPNYLDAGIKSVILHYGSPCCKRGPEAVWGGGARFCFVFLDETQHWIDTHRGGGKKNLIKP